MTGVIFLIKDLDFVVLGSGLICVPYIKQLVASVAKSFIDKQMNTNTHILL